MSELYCPLPPRDQDIYRFRQQFGASLGSYFVLGPRDDAGESNELQLLKTSIASTGLEQTQQKWESHWHSALTDDDLVWLKDVAQCRTLRLPLSFYSLGPLFSRGTPFEGDPSEVYHQCWSIVKHLIEKCQLHGIGVLIDFQASASGINLCASAKDRTIARDCVAFLAQEITFHAMTGVVGLSVSSGCEPAPDMCECYDEIFKIASAIDPSLPVYIDDSQAQCNKRVFDSCESDIPQFKSDISNGTIRIPSYMMLPEAEIRQKIKYAGAERSSFQEKALSSQVSGSWSSNNRQSFVHGWNLGFDDALRFFGAAVQGTLPPRKGADKIYDIELWIQQRKRDIDPEQLEENSAAWEGGLRRGISDFYEFIGV
ncbi:glucan 1,3-beta-glucosidase 3 [Aspergillus brasiliensis]|uniref:Glucan 1,3-beta-glucosidase 3 n=1 Tax=Aspergillus brasiliensis TaxID=319629 RepID=A0A9W5YJ57_9EURO|nr:glucan 1,3-beta-glucosidase 3 [Aspergillus brasiliensis]GKZ44381.1 glucan 1,3-beta-glucosidase 3 [Aspergillus brasiliensis]